MSSIERKVYLIIILGLVSFMGYSFASFATHYGALIELNEKVMKECHVGTMV